MVLTGPDGVRRPWVRMTPDAEQPNLWHAEVRPDEVGAWTFEVEGWSDPIGTWRHDAEIKIPAGIDVELMFTEGALLLERVSGDLPKRSDDRKTIDDAVTAVRDTSRPEPVRYSAAVSPAVDDVLARHPLRDLVSTEGPYPFFADRERALYGSWYEFFPRSEGAYVDQKTGKVVSGHAAHRREAPRRGRRDGLRRHLPAADPPDRSREPQGPQQHARPVAGRHRARRGRSGRTRAATTPSTPTSARSRTSTRSSRGPASSASRWRSTSRCRPHRTTPG